jgi:putative aminopeptidase FrvX
MNESLLRDLTQADGIASREDRVRDVVASHLKPLVDDLRVDALGNLIGVRKGKGGPRVAIAAHMDEIGFLVRHIDDNGFLRIQPVGGFDPRVLNAQRVRVHIRNGHTLPGVLQPGTKPKHLLQPGEGKELQLEDLFVDIGLPGDQVSEKVQLGDMITMRRDLEVIGDVVTSKALDDRLGVYVMLEAIRATGDVDAEIIAVASTQEEVGLRGATTSAFGIEADIAIALDVTVAADTPGIPADVAVTKLRSGTAIKMFDSSHIPNPNLVQHLRDIAEAENIPHQLEILPRGGTDAAAFQKARVGIPATTISIPTRYVHTVNEMASVTDIQASVDLLAAFLRAAGSRSYAYEIPASG